MTEDCAKAGIIVSPKICSQEKTNPPSPETLKVCSQFINCSTNLSEQQFNSEAIPSALSRQNPSNNTVPEVALSNELSMTTENETMTSMNPIEDTTA